MILLTSHDVSVIKKSIGSIIKTVKLDKTASFITITTKFLLFNNKPLTLVIYKLPNSNKFYIMDSGIIYNMLNSAYPSIYKDILSKLMASFELTYLSENNIVISQNDKAINERVNDFIRAILGIDTMIRLWFLYKNRSTSERPTGDTNDIPTTS